MTNESQSIPTSFAMIDPVSDLRWGHFVAEQPAAQIFHHPAWIALLREQYNFRTFAACLLQGDAIVAGMPICEVAPPFRRRRWVCLPFSDRCGPLGLDAPIAALSGETLRRAAAIGATLEIRDSTVSNPRLERQTTHWLHVTQLERSPEQLMKALHPDVRRRIRKARAIGLTHEIRHDSEAIALFYELHLRTRRKQGVPIQPRSYFTAFQRYIIERGLGFVMLVRRGDEVLSAAVFCTFGKTALYKYGASHPEKLELGSNYLLFWEAMTYAMQSGLRLFDFGKTTMSNDGLRFFKNKWNSIETELPYLFAPEAPSMRLHDGISERIVKPIIQHSPALVCRIAGEMLYRHFAA